MTVPAAESDAGKLRRRFIAPQRGDAAPGCFSHPLLAEFSACKAWMEASDWPGIEVFNAALAVPDRRFVVQDALLLDDGLHYEQRIQQGQIATRLHNWHDLFNAMIWVRHPGIKLALNAQQCRHIARIGPTERNRAQQALTQFDETGIIVRVRDASLLAVWDQHDWSTLFDAQAGHWQQGDIAIAAVIGHALMEQVLMPGRLLVGKCLVVQGDDDAACVARVAAAIAAGEVLCTPLELRPLPLAGIPGWHCDQEASFYAQAGYFRPLREGRVYPPALRITA